MKKISEIKFEDFHDSANLILQNLTKKKHQKLIQNLVFKV